MVDKLLSSSVDNPLVEDTEADRSETRIVFLGVMLDSTFHGAALVNMLSAVMQVDVLCAIEAAEEGQYLIETYFEWERYCTAHSFLQADVHEHMLGYDPNLEEKIAAKWAAV